MTLHHRYYLAVPNPRAARKNLHRTWQHQYDLERLATFRQHAGAVAVLAIWFFFMALIFIGG